MTKFSHRKGTNNFAINKEYNDVLVKQFEYLNSRKAPLLKLGATEAELQTAMCFNEPDKNTNGNIKLIYLDVDGNEMSYTNPDGISEPFCRVRYSPLHMEITSRDKKNKYHQPKGSWLKPYLTGLFLRPPAPENKRIYVIEGEFKALSLNLVGVPTAGLGGINSGTVAFDADGNRRKDLRANEEPQYFAIERAEFLPELQSYIVANGIKEIVLIHDADAFCPIKNSTPDNNGKLLRHQNFITAVKDTAIACNGLGINLTYIVGNNQNLKGIDDLLQHYSGTLEFDTILSDLNTLNQSSEHFTIWANCNEPAVLNAVVELFYKSTDRQPDLEIKHNGYLSELQNEQFERAIATRKKIVLQSGTGSGKTTYFSKKIIDMWYNITGLPTVIIAPLNAIVEQQKNSVSKFRNDCLFITSATLPDLNDENRYGIKAIFTNYENVPIVSEYLGVFNLIKDESHLLPESVSFKPMAVQSVVRSFNAANKILFASATPSLLGLNGMFYIKITNEKIPPPPKIAYFENSIDADAVAAVRQFAPKSGTTQIVLLDDKERIRMADLALKELGYNVATIFSDGNEPNETYKNLIATNTICPTIDVLLCTRKIATGINIETGQPITINDNGNDFRLIYIETNKNEKGFLAGFNNTLYTQFTARVRNPESINGILILTKELKKSPFARKTPRLIYQPIFEQAKKDADAINSDYRSINAKPEDYNAIEDIAYRYLCYDANGMAAINHMAIAHDVEKTHTIFSHVSDFFELDLVSLELTPETKKAATDARKKIKQAYSDAEVKACHALINPDAPEANAMASQTVSVTLSKNLKLFLKTYFSTLPTKNTLSSIENETNETAFSELHFYNKLGISLSDAHKLTFRSSNEKTRPNHLKSGMERAETKSIISTFLKRDDDGNKLKTKSSKLVSKIKQLLFEEFLKGDGLLTEAQLFAVVRKNKKKITKHDAICLAKSLLHIYHLRASYQYKFISVWTAENIEKHYGISLPKKVVIL